MMSQFYHFGQSLCHSNFIRFVSYCFCIFVKSIRIPINLCMPNFAMIALEIPEIHDFVG